MQGLVGIVRQQEIHYPDDLVAARAAPVGAVVPDGFGDGSRTVHGLETVFLKHHLREVPGLPIVFHVPNTAVAAPCDPMRAFDHRDAKSACDPPHRISRLLGRMGTSLKVLDSYQDY